MEEYSNLKAEQSILGAIILEPGILEDIKILINQNDFYYIQNALIYKEMLEIEKNNKEIDILILIEKIRSNGLLEEVGGISYLTQLSTVVPACSRYKTYCNIVKELSTKRKIKADVENLLQDLKENDITDTLDRLDRIKDTASDVNAFSSLYKSVSQVNTQRRIEKLSTGFLRLDRALNGLEIGTLMIVTGEPSTGKSTILNQIIAHNISKGEKAFLYSGELPQNKIKGWFTATVVNQEHIFEYVDEYGQERYGVKEYGGQLVDSWAQNKLFIFNDDCKPTLKNLVGAITNLNKEYGVRLVVLDNLMTMITDNFITDKNQRQTEIVSCFKNLAKKLGIAIILVAHANKESSKQKEPHLFDISGASEIANLADYVIKTMRKKETKADGSEIEGTCLFVSKNRITGEQGMAIKTYFNEKRRRFCTDYGNEIEENYGYNVDESFEQVSSDDIPF